MWLDVCVNKMAPFGSFEALSRAVLPLTVVAQWEAYPRDEMAKPPGMKVFAVERKFGQLIMVHNLWAKIKATNVLETVMPTQGRPLPKLKRLCKAQSVALT